LFILTGDRAHEILHAIAPHEINRRSPKASAGQSCAQPSGMGLRQLDERVQLRRAVLEVIARTLVALEHVLSKLFEVAVAQRPRAMDDTLNFTDDVEGALVITLRKSRAIRREHLRID